MTKDRFEFEYAAKHALTLDAYRSRFDTVQDGEGWSAIAKGAVAPEPAVVPSDEQPQAEQQEEAEPVPRCEWGFPNGRGVRAQSKQSAGSFAS